MIDLPPEAARDDIDRLAYRLWSVHPNDIKGVTRSRFYSDEIRKLIADPRKIIAESEPSPTQRDALLEIETMLLSEHRLHTKRTLVSIIHKAANRAAEALGRRVPFPEID